MVSIRYRALAVSLLLFTTAIVVSSYKIIREYEIIANKFIPNLWAAAQAEIEFLRFLDQLNAHVHSKDAASNQLPVRLYILWSRLPLLLQGSEAEHVRAVPGAVRTIEELNATLERLEPAILALRKGDAASYQAIHAELKPFEVPLHQIVAKTMLKDEEVAAVQREGVRQVYWEVLWCFAAIAISATMLVLLLFREFRNVSSLLGTAHAAEAAASAAQAQLKAVIDAVPARITAKDRVGQEVFRNKYAADLASERRGSPVGATGAASGLDLLDRQVFETGRPIALFEEAERARAGGQGQRTWVTTKVPLLDAAGHVTNVVTVSLDVSEQKEAQKRNALLATAVEHAGDVIEITDAHARFEYVNPAFERISGYLRHEALGKTPFSLLMSSKEDEPYYRFVQELVANGKVWQGILTARRKDGQLYQQETTISPVRSSDGDISHYVAVKRDITDRLRAEEQIWHLAHHDQLTDLPNRVLFQERLQHDLAQARRNDQKVAILFLDLDKFKDVNDTLGHPVGDRLLRLAAERLGAILRSSDTLARLGGDEFAIIQPAVRESNDAITLARKLLDALAAPFALDGHEVHIGASLGIALFPGDGESVDDLLKNADLALYRAKSDGRARFCFFESSMDTEIRTRKDLERELRRALERDEFELHYQPQLNLLWGTIGSVEALVRWRHPERGMLLPDAFIPIAEASGLIHALGAWILRQACQQAKAWHAAGLPLTVAVNISPAQLRHPDLLEAVDAALSASGLEPSLLELEITENLVVELEGGTAIGCIVGLAARGVRLTIDDFGTGYSSLAYLKRLPVQKIKIDRTFVRVIGNDPEGEAVVRAIITLGQTLGKRVVAEGVESRAQLDFLRMLGCDEVQGYLYSRPREASDLEHMLQGRRGRADIDPITPAHAIMRA